MDHVSNPTVAALTEILLRELRENGYSTFAIDCTKGFARCLSDFMDHNALHIYNASIGINFLEYYTPHHSKSMNSRARIYIARINSFQQGDGFISHRKLSFPVALSPGLEDLVTNYKAYCTENGLRFRTIRSYERRCRIFLKALENENIHSSSEITIAAVSKACLQLPSNYDFPVIHTFLRFLADAGHVTRDYSSVVPRFRFPQPMPSVYSVEEIQKIEAAVNRNVSFGRRDYAMLLLATRLGIRAGDIAAMTFDALDFRAEVIRLIQKKTNTPLEVPMLPIIRDALLDYIKNSRGDSVSRYVFLSLRPPYSHLSVSSVNRIVRFAIKDANISSEGRKRGPHAMRSSVASSMVNDNVPYEVVRKTLGHRSKNAIKSYAKLDVDQLKLYALEPPTATGCFADFLAGRCSKR